MRLSGDKVPGKGSTTPRTCLRGGRGCRLTAVKPVNLAEYEEAARGRLLREVYEYYAGAANDGITLRANREAYERIALHYQVLRDVTVRDTVRVEVGYA